MMLLVLCFCFILWPKAKPTQDFLVGFWVEPDECYGGSSYDVHLFSERGFLQNNAIFFQEWWRLIKRQIRHFYQHLTF